MQPGSGGATAEAAIGETDGRADIFYRVSRIIPSNGNCPKIKIKVLPPNCDELFVPEQSRRAMYVPPPRNFSVLAAHCM